MCTWRTIKKLVSLGAMALLFAACSYNERKIPEEAPEKVTGPLGFASVKAIFENRCAFCHDHATWVGQYLPTVSRIEGISTRIQSTDPAIMMPKPGAPPLTAGEKALILAWIAQGAPLEAGGAVAPAPALPPADPEPPSLPDSPVSSLPFALVKAKVFDRKCATCHATRFANFENTRPWIREMDARIRSEFAFEQMPPPHAPQLSAEEKDLVLEWIRTGAQEI